MRRLLPATVLLVLVLVLAGAARAAPPAFAPAVQLAGARGATEPRVTVTPSGSRYAITNDAKTSDAIVFGSVDGLRWTRTAAEPANQASPTIDVDIVSTRTGRLIGSELDFGGINFRTSYSDDGGKTWVESSGTTLADTDRQWFAVGPDDPGTHLPRVYLFFHDLLAGTLQHNMFVSTSKDNGATFGPPVPVTVPPSQAYQDLQCADSGGPSDIFVDQRTGRVYAVWGARTAPVGGGCGASVFGPFEVNVVAATRVWVASAAPQDTGTPGAWQNSLAVDDSASNKIVGMQLSPGAVDSTGTVYVSYPESQNAYPDYGGAAIKYVSAPANLDHWSAPRVVAPGGGVGHVLPHIVAGEDGKLDFAYFTGVARGGGLRPAWYATAAQTLDGNSATPNVTEARLSDIPVYTGTASELMGACASGPAQGVENGFACPRSTDVFGVALDAACNFTVVWPSRDNNAFAANTNRTTQAPNGPAFRSDPSIAGTFVSTQIAGATVCGSAAAAPGGTTTGGTPQARHHRAKHRRHRARHRRRHRHSRARFTG